jgi:hypothetical protein
MLTISVSDMVDQEKAEWQRTLLVLQEERAHLQKLWDFMLTSEVNNPGVGCCKGIGGPGCQNHPHDVMRSYERFFAAEQNLREEMLVIDAKIRELKVELGI